MEPFCLKDEITKQNNLIFQKIKPSNKETVKMIISKYNLSHSFLKLVSDNIQEPYPIFIEKVKQALEEREKTLNSITAYL
jgi:hypothetical protein